MKFKVGDKVKRSEGTGSNNNFNEGDTGVVFSSNYSTSGYSRVSVVMDKNGEISEGNHNLVLELVSGGKKVKEEKRNYIVVNSDCDNVEHERLLTKSEAMDKVNGSNYYAVDISNAPRYNKVTTSRMVMQKVDKKIKKKTKKKK